MDSNKETVVTNIDEEEVSPASRPYNPHGLYWFFEFTPKSYGGSTGMEVLEDGLTGLNHRVAWRMLIGNQSIKFSDGGKYY